MILSERSFIVLLNRVDIIVAHRISYFTVLWTEVLALIHVISGTCGILTFTLLVRGVPF